LSLPECEHFDYVGFANSLKRMNPTFATQLAESIGYSLPYENQFFRIHEFLQAMVAHGEDTDDNMAIVFGFQMASPKERERNEDATGFSFGSLSNTGKYRGKPCENTEKCGSRCQGVCRRILCDPWQNVGREWFKVRIAVACGVGAKEGTHAFNMGARAP
jgi:hypothetical protein